MRRYGDYKSEGEAPVPLSAPYHSISVEAGRSLLCQQGHERGFALESIPVHCRLVGPIFIQIQVFCLLVSQFGKSDAQFLDVQPRHFLIQMLGQHIDILLVIGAILPKLHLCKHLIGE